MRPTCTRPGCTRESAEPMWGIHRCFEHWCEAENYDPVRHRYRDEDLAVIEIDLTDALERTDLVVDEHPV